jgi:hypothetical protein
VLSKGTRFPRRQASQSVDDIHSGRAAIQELFDFQAHVMFPNCVNLSVATDKAWAFAVAPV